MRKLSIKLIPLFVAATFLGALLCPKITRAALESSLKVEFEQEPLFFLDNFVNRIFGGVLSKSLFNQKIPGVAISDVLNITACPGSLYIFEENDFHIFLLIQA